MMAARLRDRSPTNTAMADIARGTATIARSTPSGNPRIADTMAGSIAERACGGNQRRTAA
jgi:hypothetical protein